jgi:hypothetical protein
MHQTCAGDYLFVEQGSSQERPVDGRHDLFEGVGDLLFVEDLDHGRALAYGNDGGCGLDPPYAQQLKVLAGSPATTRLASWLPARGSQFAPAPRERPRHGRRTLGSLPRSRQSCPESRRLGD